MKEAGFTLVEVLAALLVFSVAIIGLTHSGTQSARAVSALDAKMLASIVADNQLILARQRPARVGVQTGEDTALSRAFSYDVETTKTEMLGFYQLTVNVRAKDAEQLLISRTAFKTGAP